MNNAIASIAALLPLILLASAQAGEPEPAPPIETPAPAGDWEFELGLYGFIAGLDAKISAGTQSVETSFSFSDILDQLDATFMGAASATNGRFRIAGDLMYLKVSGSAAPTGPIFEVASLDLKSLLGTVSATYRVWDQPGTWLELGGGVRYLGMDVAVTALDYDRRAPNLYEKADASAWDALAVVRFHHAFSEHWMFRFCGDIGAGDSDLTWQLFGAFIYAFNDNVAALLGWRHLAYEFGKGPVDANMAFSGPQIGLGFKF